MPKEVGRSQPYLKADRTLLGLASYALSSVFLASMLTFAKLLGKDKMPVFEILLARSSTILFIALIMCAKDGVNPFGNRCDFCLLCLGAAVCIGRRGGTGERGG